MNRTLNIYEVSMKKILDEKLRRTITTIENLKEYLTVAKLNNFEMQIENYIKICKEIDKKILLHTKDINEMNIYNENTFNILLDLMQ